MGLLMDSLKNIAVVDYAERRTRLINNLKAIGYPFVVHYGQIEGYWAENIIVKLGSGKQKLVVGAHYDNVDGSSGANDNAAGVCILLALVRYFLQNPPSLPLEFVFFDQEENGRSGSKIYLHSNSSELILGMINLDVCGYGDTIIVGPQKNLDDTVLGRAIQNILQQTSYPYTILKMLPEGDDREFEAKAIPNISVAIVPHGDVLAVEEIALADFEKRQPAKSPIVIKTMHNGELDDVSIVSEESMETVLRWTANVISQIGILM